MFSLDDMFSSRLLILSGMLMMMFGGWLLACVHVVMCLGLCSIHIVVCCLDSCSLCVYCMHRIYYL